jgi:DNA-directed RNA polymerase specialized sigma24 family protein
MDENTDFTKDPLFLRDQPMVAIPHEELDINWVYGYTCSEAFEQFTPLDRKILRMRYVEGLSDAEIARTTGYHINTINRRRNQSKKALEPYWCQ